MLTVGLHEAEGKLAELMEEAARGEEVLIQSGAGTYFQLVPLPTGTVRPRFGSAAGLVQISEDFDDPLPDFADYGP
jgi:antitoxin (DNA-binding transcriptional repressor) of toxin-antitoxin stability system